MPLGILLLAAILLAALPSRATGEASWSENAGIVWADSVRGIYRANVDGSGIRLLVPAVADSHSSPAWSPSGKTLAFSGRNSDDGALYLRRRGSKHLRVIRSDLKSPRRARSFGYLLAASWGPDEKHLVVSDAWNPVNATIKLVELPSGRMQPLTRPSWGYNDYSPAWYPDGRVVAFVRQHVSSPRRRLSPRQGRPAIYLVGSDGSGFHRLTLGTSPSWSPDGRQLVFAWSDAIYRVDSDGRNRVRLTHALGSRGLDPHWSPNGRKILYTKTVRWSPYAAELWVMDADGGNPVRAITRRDINGANWEPRPAS